jgi:hypothetical protein
MKYFANKEYKIISGILSAKIYCNIIKVVKPIHFQWLRQF